MGREVAERLGLRPRARFAAFAVCGDDPLLMLTAPIPATRRALSKAGLTLQDIDRIEINEAFASVVLAWQRESAPTSPGSTSTAVQLRLATRWARLGARLMTTLLHALERSGGRYGLQTMCEYGGMANATLIERL